jgi:hypothetical protein
MSQFEEVQVRRENAARRFVQVVQSFYPEVGDLFQRLGIKKDPIAKAYCCEIILEMQGYQKFSWFLKKAGVGFPLVTFPRKRRRQGSLFIHDGRLLYALEQLAIKVYHIPIVDRKKVRKKTFKLAKRIWNWWQRQRTISDDRVGEALGWELVLSKREG